MFNAGIPQYIEVNPKVAQLVRDDMTGAVYLRMRAIVHKASADRIIAETVRALKRAPRSKRAAIKARFRRRINATITVQVE